ncbi:hypothetical protein J6A34_02080 [bacterium]|nr:hypothetical protein [bacterium]
MKYYIFVEKDGSVNGCGQCEQLTEGVKNIEVSVDVYNSFSEDSLRYVYSNGKIIPNPNYENDKQIFFIKERIDAIYKELDELDIKRIRAVCEDEVKDEKTGETWLDYYNSQVYDLRIELASLNAQL